MAVPRIVGDNAAERHVSSLEELLKHLTPEEKEIVTEEIRYKAHLLQDQENLFYRDLAEQRCLVSIRTTRGTIVNIQGRNWTEN